MNLIDNCKATKTHIHSSPHFLEVTVNNERRFEQTSYFFHIDPLLACQRKNPHALQLKRKMYIYLYIYRILMP